MLLEDSSEPEKAGIWRRLGDAALFLTGIFPSYANKVGLGNRDGQALRHLSTVSQIREPVPESSSGLATLEWFGARWYALAAEHAVVQTAGSRLLQDYALHFDQARAILNTTADRYLYPFANGWLSAPAA
jgi:hypothetical protein